MARCVAADRTPKAAGLLERTRDPRDPHAVQPALTERGTEVARRAIDVVHVLPGQLPELFDGLDGPRTRAFTRDPTILPGTPLAASADAAGDHANAHETERSRPPATAPPADGRVIGLAHYAGRAVLEGVPTRRGTPSSSR
ncbi:hypothetical protein [Streptomyces sp. NPDC058632]|uniref:hypothetical protein n=1 Tax=unclassified Streptomyces TaxID=2593676 RepID=UPI00365E2164